MNWRKNQQQPKNQILIFNKQQGINTLYKFNLKGELIKVLYIKSEESLSFSRFKIKKGNRFYATSDGNILIYKEE